VLGVIFNNGKPKKHFGYYDIHKSLASPILEKLNKMGINEEFVFSKPEKLGEYSASRFSRILN